MIGKTNYTRYIPLGSSFSVTAMYGCTAPAVVGKCTWRLKNVGLAIATFPVPSNPSITWSYYFGRTDVEVTFNTSMSTLTVRNATMEYNGTLSAVIQEGGRSTSVDKVRSQYLLRVKVIITGIYYFPPASEY
jgi:hypothetical protein